MALPSKPAKQATEVQRQNAEEEMRQRRVQQDRDAYRQEVARRNQQENERQREKEQRRKEMRRLEQARYRQEEEHQRLEEQRKLKERRKKNDEDRQALQRLEEHRRVEAERLDVARKHAENESKRLEQLQALRQRVEARQQEVARRRAAQEAARNASIPMSAAQLELEKRLRPPESVQPQTLDTPEQQSEYAAQQQGRCATVQQGHEQVPLSDGMPKPKNGQFYMVRLITPETWPEHVFQQQHEQAPLSDGTPKSEILPLQWRNTPEDWTQEPVAEQSPSIADSSPSQAEMGAQKSQMASMAAGFEMQTAAAQTADYAKQMAERALDCLQVTQSSGSSSALTDTNQHSLVHCFEDLDLQEGLLRGIYEYGIEKPSAIQQHLMRPVLDGRHAIGQARSGSGKTALCVIGSIQRINCSLQGCQSLMLAPTCDSALQIKKMVLAFGCHLKITCRLCTSSHTLRDDIDQLRAGPHVVVGTPGRILSMMTKGHLQVDNLLTLVLDSADEVLSQGFKDEIWNILGRLSADVQICLFSSIMTSGILDVADTYLKRNAVQVFMDRDEAALSSMRQFIRQLCIVIGDRDRDGELKVDEEHKVDLLCELRGMLDRFKKVIIYCGSRRKMECLASELAKRNFVVLTLQEELGKKMHHVVQCKFNPILLCTDLTTQEFEVPQGSLVINFDLPHSMEKYLSRLGRSYCLGQEGMVFNFVTKYEVSTMQAIQKYCGVQFEVFEDPEVLSDVILRYPRQTDGQQGQGYCRQPQQTEAALVAAA